jgi:hypothetical protein
VNEEGMPLPALFLCGGTSNNDLYRLNKKISPKIHKVDFGESEEIKLCSDNFGNDTLSVIQH